MSHRFSPRPNRAAEIGWMDWGPEAFERAKTSDRPILLGISAVWCHWCHVMDETTYSDQRVIDLIRDRYVPVRVDNDRHPEINARYNMGGWPTTAFLSPSGEILTGATYIPPDDFTRVLERVASLWKDERADIERRLHDREQTRGASAAAANASLDPQAVSSIAASISAGYDEEFGGFGDAPKFPQSDALRFLLLLYRRDRAEGKADERLYKMLARTALAMGRGGMYDHVEGGFFRYSTTRDWSIPHFEKMAEDHAGLLRFYADLYRVSGNEEFATTLRSALRWLRGVLRNPESSLFGGSQDADEAYFAVPLEERRRRDAPFVDRTIYTNWNAGLAAALVAAGIALDDDTLIADARANVEELYAQMLGPRGLLLHFKPPGAEPQGVLLSDQAALLDALLLVHAATGQDTFLTRARALAGETIERFRQPDGAFTDSDNAGDDALGNMRIAHRPLDENAKLADALLRLGAVLQEPDYGEVARAILAALDASWRRAGSFAAAYGAAVVRAEAEPLTVTIVGAPADTEVLRDAALRLPNPLSTVHTFSPDDPALHARGYLESDVPLAYVCAGTRCAAPARDAATLAESYDALRQLPVR